MRLPACALLFVVCAAAQEASIPQLLNRAKEARAAGDPAMAESLYRQAITTAERDAPGTGKLAQAYNNLATFLFERASFEEAEQRYRAAAKLWEDLGDNETADYAACMNNLAALERTRGQFGPAELHYRKALTLRLALAAASRRDLATTRGNLGELYQTLGRYAEAEVYLKQAVEGLASGEMTAHASALNNLGVLYRTTGRNTEAEKAYREVVRLRTAALGRSHPLTASALGNLAELIGVKGDVREAETLFAEAIAVKTANLAPNHPDVFKTRINRADLWFNTGRIAEASGEYEVIATALEAAMGPNHPYLGFALNGLARCRTSQGRYAESGVLFERARALFETTHGGSHPAVGGLLSNDAERLLRMGDYEAAVRQLTRARSVYLTAYGSEHPEVAQLEQMLGNAHQMANQPGEAEAAFRRAVTIWEKTPPKSVAYANALARLAGLRDMAGQHEEAGRLLARAEEAAPESSAADMLENRALHAAAMSDYRGAEEALRKALTIRDGQPAAPEARATTERLLGEVFTSQGRLQSAEEQYRRAIKLLEPEAKRNWQGLAVALKQLASALYQEGRIPEARRTLTRAAALWESHGDEASLGMALGNIGVMQYAEGRLREAHESLARSADLLTKTRGRDDAEVAIAFANLAMVETSLGRHDEAEAHVRKSLGIARTPGALKTYATLLRKMRRQQEAARYEEQAEAIVSGQSLLPRQ